MARHPKVEVWQSEKNGQFYFHVKTANGKITDASEGYTQSGSRNRAAYKHADMLHHIADPNA